MSNTSRRQWRRTTVAITIAALVLVASACAPAAGPVAAPTAPAPAAPTSKPAATQLTPPAQSQGGATSAAAVQGPLEGEAKSLTGAGATFPAPLYSKWFAEYEKLTGVQVNYQSIGSGGGIKSISDMTVDVGATDGPMSDEQLKAARGGEILHIPTALGAVVPTYNLPEVSKPLRFTPETLSGIFLGEITKWNDPKLLADNPDAGLPNQEIVVVHRSDGSGTTYIWTDYLSSVNEKWKSSVGRGTSVNWPVGLGGKGNEGVAGEVKQNPYAIGYVELIYALQNKLAVGSVKNKADKFVEPNLNGVTAAAAGVADSIAPDLRASIVNAPGAEAYPISGFTWLLAYKEQKEQPKALALTRMMWWAIHDGQRFNADLGYAPLPESIVKQAEEKILSITLGGKSVLPR